MTNTMATAPTANVTKYKLIKNERDALALYEELIKSTQPNIAVQTVIKQIISSANKTATSGPLHRRALHAAELANDIFVAFAKLLFAEHQSFVSRHALMGHLRTNYPIIFNFLRTNGFKPARDFERSERS